MKDEPYAHTVQNAMKRGEIHPAAIDTTMRIVFGCLVDWHFPSPGLNELRLDVCHVSN